MLDTFTSNSGSSCDYPTIAAETDSLEARSTALAGSIDRIRRLIRAEVTVWNLAGVDRCEIAEALELFENAIHDGVGASRRALVGEYAERMLGGVPAQCRPNERPLTE